MAKPVDHATLPERPTWNSEMIRLADVVNKVYIKMKDNLWEYSFDESKNFAPPIAMKPNTSAMNPFELGYPTCFRFVDAYLKTIGTDAPKHNQIMSEVRKAAYEVLPKRPTELEMFMILTFGLPHPDDDMLVSYDCIIGSMTGWRLTKQPDGTSQWTHESHVFGNQS